MAHVNPLSYMVVCVRSLLVYGSYSQLPMRLGILAAVTLAISMLSAYLYPKVVI
jgi:ABC-type polysaccharide/polyol phosphate export permease